MSTDQNWKCNYCGAPNGPARNNCWNCDKDKKYSGPLGQNFQEDFLKEKEAAREINEKIKNITVTTAPFLEGYHVLETIDIVTAECVFGINLFRDFFAGMTDIFGGRSESTQKVLKAARIFCLDALKREAQALGANAVIAVDLDYSEFSGKGKSMLFLVASGTAVKVEKIDKPTQTQGVNN